MAALVVEPLGVASIEASRALFILGGVAIPFSLFCRTFLCTIKDLKQSACSSF